MFFTASLTCIGVLSANSVSETTGSTEVDQSTTYLPFYSSAAVFTVLNFVVYGSFIGIRNCVRYIRYGVTSASDYYTSEDTLKVGSLLITLFAGELLFSGLISFFYIQQTSYQYGVI